MMLILGASKNGNASFPTSDVSLYSCSMMLFTAPPDLFAFLRGTNHSWPLLGHPIAPQPLALDEHLPIEGWIKPNGEAQKGNFLNIQASSSKRSTWRGKKNKSPFFVSNSCFVVFEVEGKKTSDSKKINQKRVEIQNCHDLSPDASRLSSTMMPSMTSKMEPTKNPACLFVQNGPVSEKDRDLVGFVWVSFTNSSKKEKVCFTCWNYMQARDGSQPRINP